MNSRVNPYLFYYLFVVVVAGLSAAIVYGEFDTAALEGYLIGINVAALFCMGLDKSLARSPNLRIPEGVLLTLALAGGVPGVFLGSHIFRHKTRKASFQFSLLLIVALQCALIRFLGIW